MKIHEYQAKELLLAYGIPIPRQKLAGTIEQAALAAQALGGQCVLKAQAHTGGRGKAGGVRLAESASRAAEIAGELLGKRLVTEQSGPAGYPIEKVLVTARERIESEYYLAVALNDALACPEIICSGEGGTEIEALARERPELIHHIIIPPESGYCEYHGYEAARPLGLSPERKRRLVSILRGMYRLFVEKDCSLVEINPLAAIREDTLAALDAKISFDDNALFLHPELEALRDPSQEDPNEARARETGISYITLDGSIGCLVNGAGLAMATMDMIRSLGARPANFLDVGGSATAEKVASAFTMLLSDPRVKVILVNIFGGITRCDVIAAGIAAAARHTELSIPLVVRLQGAHLAAGQRILSESGLPIIQAREFREAVEKAVTAAGGERL
ncbi:MAG: ADP-forming succinate--CoA ligase subunit beta [Peptococcaceae bacterium]|jgi:succinyl-CoA synthetase beta subunit|nr:ADP-forming succinate--CoA ligase subunit beta [Peptococcaceae bacterium]